ncbi:hypothetical protein [Niveibacterium terrae]|uniref:hypothetical protein n=1 Tax=Niveibacterium terrae TaxID=3373598 RepID=UPI003A90C7BB
MALLQKEAKAGLSGDSGQIGLNSGAPAGSGVAQAVLGVEKFAFSPNFGDQVVDSPRVSGTSY